MAWISLALAAALTWGDGYDYLARGKPLYARTAFRNQLRKHPGDVKLLIGLGMAEVALGNPDAATGPLLEALRDAPRRADARRTLAQCLWMRAEQRIATGRDDETARLLLLDAADQARRAVALDDTDAASCLVLAKASLALGSLDDAERALADAQRLGLDAETLQTARESLESMRVFQRLASLGDIDAETAIGELRTLLERAPDSPELWLRLGDIHHLNQQWDEALDAYDAALRLDPFRRPCLELLLAYLPFQHLRAHAARVLESAATAARAQVSKNDPRLAFPLYGVGVAHLWERAYSEAATHFEDALKLEESLAIPAGLGLADARFRENAYDAAAEAYLAASRTDLDEATARVAHLARPDIVASQLQFLSRRQIDAKRSVEARDLMAFAYALQPEHAAIVNDYAFLCRETKEYSESARAYRTLIELRPDHPRSLNDAAVVLHYHRDRLDDARGLYERAIESGRRILDNPRTVPEVRASAEEAIKDARNNLKKLEKRAAKKRSGESRPALRS